MFLSRNKAARPCLLLLWEWYLSCCFASQICITRRFFCCFSFTDELKWINKVCSFSFTSRLNCHKLIHKLIELVTLQLAPDNWNESRQSQFNLFWAGTINEKNFHFFLIGLESVTYMWQLSLCKMHPRSSFILFTL